MALSLSSERATVQDPLAGYAIQGDNLYAPPAHDQPSSR